LRLPRPRRLQRRRPHWGRRARRSRSARACRGRRLVPARSDRLARDADGAAVEALEGLAELSTLLLESREREHKTPVALGCQTQVGDSRIALGLLALDQAGGLGASDELGHGALRKLQPLG